MLITTPFQAQGQANQRFLTTPQRVLFGENASHSQSRESSLPINFYTPLVYLASRFFIEPRLAKRFFSKPFEGFIPPDKVAQLCPVQHVDFNSLDGLRLKGHWIPSTTYSDKVVVMGHGYKGDWRGLLEVAQHIRTQQNANVFLFDFRAHGDSDGIQSSFGYHEGKDVAAAIDYVKTHFKSQTKQLIYYGHSAGAAAMMLTPHTLEDNPSTLNKMNQAIDGLILDSPYAHIKIMEQKEVKALMNWQAHPLLVSLLRSLTRNIVNHLEAHAQSALKLAIPLSEFQPAMYLKKHTLVQKPILHYHGTQDATTSFKQAEAIHRELKQQNPQVQFVALKGADHWGKKWQPFHKGEEYRTLIREKSYLPSLDRFLNQVFKPTNPVHQQST